ncbi:MULTISPECIES: acyltransferase family protein [Methylobacterium]|uniref:Acyltransferase 3 domain-containing protein n=1 Tax=Methylobacterium thuringiense TaxID=1003091 RepID=A0ABQ4TQM3_9HYPH|nr:MULTISPECIES: acyltransferase [Methylobacterium]TXN20628.1 acyltransferase [Methylobacterium sp. WL9]GJE55925.1 hypothetical protein EKPJFOCH_2422 [Methylobacterium thuringiense]
MDHALPLGCSRRSPQAPVRAADVRAEPLHALTALRFVAAAYVLLFHFDAFYFHDYRKIDAILMGYSGVTFFFLLSGFVLAHSYAQVDLGDRRVLSRFWRARIARIVPVYLVSLAISLPFLLSWAAKSAEPLRELLLSGIVLAPLGLHAWVPGAACSLNCPTWSISTELFFYVLFPLLLPVVLRRPLAATLATLALWCGTAAAAMAVWLAYGEGGSLIDPAGTGPVLAAQFVKFFPLLRLPEFIAGLLLYVLWQRVTIPIFWLVAAMAVAMALLSLLLPLLPEPIAHNGLTVLFWAPLVLLGAAIRRGPLVSRPFVVLGRISFEVYLLHTPVYAAINGLDRVILGGAGAADWPWLTATTATLATLALSAVVHLYYSDPLRRAILKGRVAPSAPPARTRDDRPSLYDMIRFGTVRNRLP